MKLKIAVLVKQVPDHEAGVAVKPGQEPEIEERYVCSFFDEIAVEAALKIKNDLPEADIIALSAGGRRAVDALRRAVAMGIDQVEHLGDQTLEKADNYYIAHVLAARLKTIQPHLVLCGKQAGDDDYAAVGAMTAEFLGVPHIGAAVSLAVSSDATKITIAREMAGEIWSLESSFPLLVTAEKGLAEPHVPLVMRVMKAMKTQIPNIPLAQLDLQGIAPQGRLRRLGYLTPPARPPVTMMQEPFPQNVKELVAHLRQKGVL